MTVQTPPWAIQGSSHPAEVGRNLTAAMFGVPVAAATAAVQLATVGGGHGVVGSGDLAVTQNGTPNMSVNVASGRALVRSGGSSSLLAGSYALLNDATVNVAIAAADATNPRKDLVIAQVRDTNYGEAADDARITVVTGTPAASPSDPSLTSYPNCVVLARVTVAALDTAIGTADITDLRTFAAALGGKQRCLSTVRPTGASLYAGLEIFETDTLRTLEYDGTGWVIMSEPVQTYTPTWTQTAAVTKTVDFARYIRSNGWCKGSFQLTATGAGTAAGTITGGLPIEGRNVGELIGPVELSDVSVPEYSIGAAYVASGGLTFVYITQGASTNYRNTPTIAAGDVFYVKFEYEMATRYL